MARKIETEKKIKPDRTTVVKKMASHVPLQQLRFTVLFSFRDKYIYFPIGKVANSSLKWMFYILEGRSVVAYKNKWKRMEDYVHDQFYGPLLKLFQIEGAPGFVDRLMLSKDFKKIAFVRNPYSRLLSAYQDRAQAPRSGLRKAYKEFLQTGGVDWDTNTFAHFVHFAVSHLDKKSMDPHIRPQFNCLFCGEVEMDFVGKMEDMQEELERLEKLLNVKLPVIGFHSPAKTNADNKLDQYYTPELRRMVSEYYADDFEKYGYYV